MYLANGTNTTNATEAESYVYHIIALKHMNGTSSSNIQVIKKTSAVVTVELPSAVETSSQPFSGKFRLTCPGPVNNDVASNPFLSREMKLNESPYWVASLIYFNCSGTYDKLEVWKQNTNPYTENGIGYFIRFVGMPGSNPQMRIVSSDTEPL